VEIIMRNFRSLLGAVGILAASGMAAHADVIVAANSAAFGNGPIGAFNFTTGSPVNSFVPDGAFDSNNGRGLAMTLDRYFYTELLGGFGATDMIRIAPYNNGLGGADIGSFANPAPGQGVQALAFGAAGLYVLTGYPSSTPTVWVLNGVTGALVGGPITLQGADPGMDGFTVLPDGSFLGNLGDALNQYTHWDATGTNTGNNFSVPNCGGATGVDIAPDGGSLYFMCDFGSFVQTDFLGNFIAKIDAPGGAWEDIAIQQQFVCTDPNGCVPDDGGVPEPVTLSLFGAGLAGISAIRRRRRSKS
jgi:hypothetical protein